MEAFLTFASDYRRLYEVVSGSPFRVRALQARLGINDFLSHSWDASGIAYNVDLWRECLRVMKPGSHLLAFGGTRTSHRMVCAIEDAGFEIVDTIAWIFAAHFPKRMTLFTAFRRTISLRCERTARFRDQPQDRRSSTTSLARTPA